MKLLLKRHFLRIPRLPKHPLAFQLRQDGPAALSLTKMLSSHHLQTEVTVLHCRRPQRTVESLAVSMWLRIPADPRHLHRLWHQQDLPLCLGHLYLNQRITEC